MIMDRLQTFVGKILGKPRQCGPNPVSQATAVDPSTCQRYSAKPQDRSNRFAKIYSNRSRTQPFPAPIDQEAGTDMSPKKEISV